MTMIQIRNVPPELHRTLKARAAEDGVSLSDYLLRIIRREGERPSNREFLERLRQLEPVELGDLPARIIRDMRDAG